MIPDHVASLAIVLLVLWLLYRWGVVIFTLLAFIYFWRGEWALAMLAWIYACFIDLVCTPGLWLGWTISGRRVWLRKRFRWFPDASQSD